MSAGFGRQLYDIHELLAADQVIEVLEERDQLLGACAEAFEGPPLRGEYPRPEGGFAAPTAFDSAAGERVVRAMTAAPASAGVLAFQGALWPDYDALVKRVPGGYGCG